MKISRLSVLVLFFFAQIVYADTPERSKDLYSLSLLELTQLDVSIATGNSVPLDKAPSTASVINSRDIEAMGARTLDEVLELIPGLHVAPSSLSRLDSTYVIRGIHSGFNSQVLLLLNGVPIQNTVQGGRPTLFRLPVTSIDRLEVIRGPGSAIYGADAFAGVINVITKDSSISNEKITLGVGSFDTQEYSFSGATRWQDLDISLVMSYQKSEGDDARRISSDLQSRLDQSLLTDVSLAPGTLSTDYKVLDSHMTIKTDAWHLNLWSWVMRDAGVGAGGAQALDPDGYDDGDIMMADFAYDFQNLSSDWQSQIKLSFFQLDHQTHFVLLPPGALIPIGADGNVNFRQPVGLVKFTEGLIGNPGGKSDDGQIEWVSIYSGFDLHRMRLAIGKRYLSVTATETKNFGPGVLDQSPLPAEVSGQLTDVGHTENIFLADHSRNIQYLSVQDEWQLTSDLNLTAGLRYDDYSDFGHTTNPRLALIWAGSTSWVTKLMLGSAFRAPSFMELYGKNNPVSLGNPFLKPEQIDSVELSFNWSISENVQTILTLFDYTAKDMIVFEPNANNIDKTAENTLTQQAEGYEWEVNWQLNDAWRIQTSYSWHNAMNTQNDFRTPYAPRSLGKMNISYQANIDWSVTSQLFWVADRSRNLNDARDKIEDYSLWNINIQRRNFLKNMDVNFAVRNLLDEDIREPSTGEVAEDYPMESRGVWAGANFSF